PGCHDRITGEAGLGLVEIMLAITILSVVLMSLGGLMFQVSRHTRLSAQVGYRSAAQQNAAAWAQALPWDSIPPSVGWTPNDTIGQFVFQRYMSYATSGNSRMMTIVIQPVAGVTSSAGVQPETLTVVRAKPLSTAPLKVK
ncbi:MAG: hypothetical protein HY560_09360, partial [Gemmatimonadetes bacterium]|nr:hypothetical protein [Gemmatimonadota bacterium]